jgi:hypothetical protein
MLQPLFCALIQMTPLPAIMQPATPLHGLSRVLHVLMFDHLDQARGNLLRILNYKKGATGEVSLQTRLRFDLGPFYQFLNFAQGENLVHKIQMHT